MRTFDPRKWGFEAPRWFAGLAERFFQRAAKRLGRDKIIDIQRDVLVGAVGRLGSKSPLTVNGMERLALQLRDAGDVNESIVLLTDVVERRIEALGRDHVHTANSEANLAFSLCEADRHDEAIPLLEHSIEVMSKAKGPDDVWVLAMVTTLGSSLVTLRRDEDAVDVLEPVIPRLERVMGPESERTINSLSWLALAQAHQKKYGPAIELQRRVVEANATKHGTDSPSTQELRLDLAIFLHWASEDAEARLVGQAVLATNMRLGVDDDTTARVRRLLADIDKTDPQG